MDKTGANADAAALAWDITWALESILSSFTPTTVNGASGEGPAITTLLQPEQIGPYSSPFTFTRSGVISNICLRTI